MGEGFGHLAPFGDVFDIDEDPTHVGIREQVGEPALEVAGGAVGTVAPAPELHRVGPFGPVDGRIEGGVEAGQVLGQHQVVETDPVQLAQLGAEQVNGSVVGVAEGPVRLADQQGVAGPAGKPAEAPGAAGGRFGLLAQFGDIGEGGRHQGPGLALDG